LFGIALLVPKKARKTSLRLAFSLILMLISFFIIRPYWIDYKVSIKTEQLNLYLGQKYPNQEWTYTYLVSDDNNISLNSYSDALL
ncbi:MAG TPA: hypothetical protein VGI33_04410, partial [Paenibacillus sp.]